MKANASLFSNIYQCLTSGEKHCIYFNTSTKMKFTNF